MTELEAALAAGAKDVPQGSDLERALAAGGQDYNATAAPPSGGDRVSPHGLSDLVKGEGGEAPAGPKFSGTDTFLLNATNIFGAAPVISGALQYAIHGRPYAQGRDEYRKAIELANEDPEHSIARIAGKGANLISETVVGGGVGKALGAAAKGIRALAPAAEATNVGLGTYHPVIAAALKGGAGGAAYGAAGGAGEAASKGEAIAPAALGGAALGGALGATIGGVAGKLGEIFKHAPEREGANQLKKLVAGDGTAGSATMTVKKLVDRQKTPILDYLERDHELAGVLGKPAREVSPLVAERLEAVGSQLDPHYDVIDGATGGVSIHNLVNFLDDQVAQLKKTPLNELYVKAVNDIKHSALDAWAPEALRKLKGHERLNELGIDIPARLVPEDVFVPTRDVRALVTRLQTRGSQVINPLNPGEASQMKADMAGMMKDFIDSHLDIAGEQTPQVQMAVDAIRDLNRDYSALKTMAKALDQRGQKESVGNMSLAGHAGSMFKHGGALASIPMLMHGNVPAAAATFIGGQVIPKIPAAMAGANSMLSTLNKAAQEGNPRALRLLKAMGAAKNVGTAGAGAVGGMTGGSLASQEAQP